MTNDMQYGIIDPESVGAMTGLEMMQAICAGDLPQAPIAGALGFRMVEATEGTAVFEGVPAVGYYNPLGSIHGGWYGTLLDSCMGCAVHTTLPAGVGYTTLEYGVHLVRAITAETGPVRAEGHIVHRGRRVATAEGRLIDGNGKLLAHGTTTCIIL